MRPIGLGHRKRVGKDELAKRIATVTGGKIVSFASKLKEVCHLAYAWAGLQDEQYYEDHPEQKEIVLPLLGISPRDVYIRVGMAMRSIHPGTWVNAAMTDGDIFKDVRFENEADAILARGGLVVRVDRKTAPVGEDVADNALAKYGRWTHIIENNGSIDNLDAVAKHLGGMLT